MKEFLSQKGVSWVEKYVDQDRAAAIEMIRRSGQQGVPVTVIDDEVIVGFNRPQLERVIARIKSRSAAAGAGAEQGRRSLGAKVADANRYAMPGGTAAQGAYVGGINPGSPAEAAGLKVGDVIVAVEGRPVGSVDDLVRAMKESGRTSLVLSVARGTTRRDVVVRLV